MKTSMIIIVVILFLIPTVYGTNTITDVLYRADLPIKVIEVIFDEFPAQWNTQTWKMYVDGEEWPTIGGPGEPTISPNAPIGEATGFWIGAKPWLSSIEGTNFPCCGAIQFDIPGPGLTNTFEYNLISQGCKTNSPKACGAIGSQSIGNQQGEPKPSWPLGMTREENADRPGSPEQNYNSYSMATADPRLCAEDCANDGKCDAFTYVKPGARGINSQPECWLKGPGVPTRMQNTWCISGRKESAFITGGLGAPNYDRIALQGEVFYIPQPGISSLPNFDDLVFSRLIYTKFLNMIPQTSSIGFRDVGKSDWFVVRYGGKFDVETKGTYKFRLASDDGSRLLIDGKTIIDNDGLHSIQSKSGEVYLDYGVHDIEVDYFQGTGTAALGLFAIPPESTKEILFMPEYGAISHYSLVGKADLTTKIVSFITVPGGAKVEVVDNEGPKRIGTTNCSVELYGYDLEGNEIENVYTLSKTGYKTHSDAVTGFSVFWEFEKRHE